MFIAGTVSVPMDADIIEDGRFIEVCATLCILEAGGSLEWPITITLFTSDITGISVTTHPIKLSLLFLFSNFLGLQPYNFNS